MKRKKHTEINKQLGSTAKKKKQENLFIESAGSGNYLAVKQLIEKGIDIYVQDECAFVLAANYGHLEVVRLLLDKASEEDIKARSNLRLTANNALITALNTGNWEIAHFLFKKGARHDKLFPLAMFHGRFEILNLLLATGANSQSQNDAALCWLAQHRQPVMVGYLLTWYKEPFDFSHIADTLQPATFALSNLSKIAGVSPAFREEVIQLQKALMMSLEENTALPEPLMPLWKEIATTLEKEWKILAKTLAESELPILKVLPHLAGRSSASLLDFLPKDLQSELLAFSLGKKMPSFMENALAHQFKTGYQSPAILQRALESSILLDDPKADSLTIATSIHNKMDKDITGPHTHRYIREAIQQKVQENGLQLPS